MAKMDRRTFLKLSGGFAAAGVLGACAADSREDNGVARGAGSADSSALDDLAKQLNGKLLQPGTSAYDRKYIPANTRFADVHPLALAMCKNEKDVATAINWSREHGVKPVPRGGGHNYAGFSTTTGLVIDIGELRSAQVDARTGRAVVGGATRNQDLFDYYDTQRDGQWLLPAGTCPGVGVGGLVLGGGIGYNSHWAGLTSDHLVETRVVTAQGEVLIASERSNSDLFWACQGGAGGNFGINTEFTFDLVRVPRQTVGYYRLDWRGAEAAEAAIRAYDQLQHQAPAEFSSVLVLTAVPLIDGESSADAVTVMSRSIFVGPENKLQELLADMLAIKSGRTMTTIETRNFWSAQGEFRGGVSAPHAFADTTRYTNERLPADVATQLTQHLVNAPTRAAETTAALWFLGWVGGPFMRSIKPDQTAYVHRDVAMLVRPTISWPTDATTVGDSLMRWRDGAAAILAPNTPARSYQNFPNLDLPQPQQAYYGDNLPRLIDVKTKYDPDNLFRNAQSIPVNL